MLADRMMAYALDARRWVEVFSQHGVRLVPHNVSDLRMKATDEGLTIRTLQGKGVLAPRLCVCCVYERHMPAALEQLGTTCLPSSTMVDLCYDKALVAQSQLVASDGRLGGALLEIVHLK